MHYRCSKKNRADSRRAHRSKNIFTSRRLTSPCSSAESPYIRTRCTQRSTCTGNRTRSPSTPSRHFVVLVGIPEVEHFSGDSDTSRDLSDSNPFLDDLVQCAEEDTVTVNIATGEAKPDVDEKLGRFSTLVSGGTGARAPNVVQQVKRWWKWRGMVFVRPRVVSGRMDVLDEWLETSFSLGIGVAFWNSCVLSI
ncbi:hypothetical protein BKA93DRAFT_930561 [Sparassis latifolia]